MTIDPVPSYMRKVRALCARPILSDPAARIQFLYNLQAYWTRQINAFAKGKKVAHPPADIHEILDSISDLIKEYRNEP